MRTLYTRDRLAVLALRGVMALIIVMVLWTLTATPARADCTSPAATAGATKYFTTPKVFELCNGTNWIPYASTQWIMISGASDDYQTCGIRGDGSLWCWGNNIYGELGDNTTTERHVPTAVSGNYIWKFIAVGDGNTCGIQTDNTMWCWGGNGNGSLGVGDSTDRHVPTQVSGGGSWKFIGGGANTCAIKTNGTMWCMGYGPWGQNGNNTLATQYAPTQVSNVGTNSWLSVSVGLYHACGIQSDNSLWCWGRNESGSNGNNSTTQTNKPTAVTGGGSWKMVSVANDISCGVKTDGTGWCWGYGGNGGLGNNTTTATQKTPVQISTTGVNTWKTLSAGQNRACGILTDGKAYCWGPNNLGEGGTGSTNAMNKIPVIVTGGSTWLSIATQFDSACAVKSDSSLWCWGQNKNGEIGDNTATQRNSPTATLFTSTSPTCSTAGQIEYDTSLGDYKYCNGSNWTPFSCNPSSCTCTFGSCSTPNALQFFSATNTLAFCNASVWQAIANPSCP